MLLIISIIFIIFLWIDGSRKSKEIASLEAKAAWFEKEFGPPPSEIDFEDSNTQNSIINSSIEKPVIDGAKGDPIEGVEHWNAMGVIKDTGTFTLTQNSILYIGDKTDLRILPGEIVKITSDYDQIKIKTSKGETWRFDASKLREAGISEELISKTLSY